MRRHSLCACDLSVCKVEEQDENAGSLSHLSVESAALPWMYYVVITLDPVIIKRSIFLIGELATGEHGLNLPAAASICSEPSDTRFTNGGRLRFNTTGRLYRSIATHTPCEDVITTS